MGASQSKSVGVLGVGRFGSKILASLKKSSSIRVLWTADAISNYWNLESPDWVFICTPHEFHYEQALFFLSRGVNVFLEKPASLSLPATEELYARADKAGVSLYIDDVYAWSGARVRSSVKHHYRSKNKHHSFLDLIAYHYLYLIFYQDPSVSVPEILNATTRESRRLFSLGFSSGEQYDFDIDVNSDEFLVSTPGLYEPNAIDEMVSAVVHRRANFLMNRKGALFASLVVSSLKACFAENCAVVGGGLYGISIAIKLAAKGHQVTLYEEKKALLNGASGVNQYRLHRGFHYPRSPQTREQCESSYIIFRRVFGRAVIDNYEHFYAVARYNSKTPPEEYLASMSASSLDYELTDPIKNCALTIRTQEASFSPKVLREISEERLFGCGVNVVLGKKPNDSDLKGFDKIFYATYKNLNETLSPPVNFKYQIVEKIAVKVPPEFKSKSLVVMDGPFFSIDPHPDFDFHVIGAVVDANHFVENGHGISPSYKPWNLDTGELDPQPEQTNRHRIMSLLNRYLDFEPEYVGSFFITKTIRADQEASDDRRYWIKVSQDHREFHILGGKISAAPLAAEEIIDILES